MDFIFTSLQRLGTDRESTSTSLARELARQGHRVLYVNSPVDRKDLFRTPADPFVAAHVAAIRAGETPLRALDANLWVLHPPTVIDSFNWVPSTAAFRQLIKLNNRRLAADICSALRQLGFADFILINDKDLFRSFYLKELLAPRQYVYLDRDYTVGMPYWRRHGRTLEPALLRKADAVLCNSLDFTARARQYNPRSYYIGNGFDAAQFADAEHAPEPADLAAIPGPRIGYVGALLTLRLDLPLLLALARARPAWQFVLVGWEDADFAQSALHGLPNVHFLGRKHTREVPAYVRHFDVCINPQVLNDITRSNFPLKILEYLAVGKPVVATTTNTMTEVFGQHTYLATNLPEYEAALARALADDSAAAAAERMAFAQQFSWTEVARLLLRHLHEAESVA
jgi:teichuronic acid biosynthesis glycosyltransferase TuaH